MASSSINRSPRSNGSSTEHAATWPAPRSCCSKPAQNWQIGRRQAFVEHFTHSMRLVMSSGTHDLIVANALTRALHCSNRELAGLGSVSDPLKTGNCGGVHAHGPRIEVDPASRSHRLRRSWAAPFGWPRAASCLDLHDQRPAIMQNDHVGVRLNSPNGQKLVTVRKLVDPRRKLPLRDRLHQIPHHS